MTHNPLYLEPSRIKTRREGREHGLCLPLKGISSQHHHSSRRIPCNSFVEGEDTWHRARPSVSILPPVSRSHSYDSQPNQKHFTSVPHKPGLVANARDPSALEVWARWSEGHNHPVLEEVSLEYMKTCLKIKVKFGMLLSVLTVLTFAHSPEEG